MAGINWLIEQLRNAISGGGDRGNDAMTADRALSYAPVWYAVNKISGHIGRLPLNLHRITGDQNRKITNHLGYRLLRVKPNAYQVPFTFKRQITAHALLWGNGRAYIHRDGLNSELIPLMPDRTDTVLVEGEKIHFTKVDRDDRLDIWDDIKRAMAQSKRDGIGNSVVAIPDSEVIHIHGLGFDGVKGKSLISLAAQSWGVGIGAETQERKKQRKGYSGGLMLEAPEGAFRKEQDAQEFLKFFRDSHDGEENAGKTGLLRAGIKANVLAMSNQDAQFIEQRMFQRQEAALWFLLEQILGDDSSVSYNSLEQKNLAYLQNCLGSWLTMWEEETESKLLSPSEIDQGFYFKFNDGALLRTDKQTTAQIVSTLITSRVINPNEAREMFEMNPYEGGEVYENPAVTSGSPGQTDERDSEDDGQLNTRAAESRVRNLIGVESNRVRNAVKSQNFLDWMDKFYAKWETKLASAIEEIGGSGEVAKAHCEESKRQLLACTDATQEEFAGLIEACVATWADRVAVIIEDMEIAKC
jgi:HK97 family phage portal protein